MPNNPLSSAVPVSASSNPIDIAVIGATGAVGEQLLGVLAEGALPLGKIELYASRARRESSVSFGERSLPLRDLEDVLESAPQLVFLAAPGSVGDGLIAALHRQGSLVIDIGGSVGSSFALPVVLPGVGEPPEQAVADAGGLRTPSPAGWLLSTLVAPLRPLGLRSVSGVINISASFAGRSGIEELGGQVGALLNSREPPRKVFQEGLAFDTVLDAGLDDEWTDREQRAASEVEDLTGLSADAVGAQIVWQPLFTGISAGLHLTGVSVAQVESAWREVEGLNRVERPGRLRPRSTTQRQGLYWGRLRADRAGDGVHVWVVGDNLLGAGAALPVRAALWALGAGLIGQGQA